MYRERFVVRWSWSPVESADSWAENLLVILQIRDIRLWTKQKKMYWQYKYGRYLIFSSIPGWNCPRSPQDRLFRTCPTALQISSLPDWNRNWELKYRYWKYNCNTDIPVPSCAVIFDKRPSHNMDRLEVRCRVVRWSKYLKNTKYGIEIHFFREIVFYSPLWRRILSWKTAGLSSNPPHTGTHLTFDKQHRSKKYICIVTVSSDSILIYVGHISSFFSLWIKSIQRCPYGAKVTPYAIHFNKWHNRPIFQKTYQLVGRYGDVFDFSPAHEQVVPDSCWLPGMDFQWIVRSGENAVPFIVECYRPANKIKPWSRNKNNNRQVEVSRPPDLRD